MNIKTTRVILILAALYNVLWGSLASLAPHVVYFSDTPSSDGLILMRCIGMLVGVYGLGYYIASLDPNRYWPLVLVGLVGKVLGPIGAVYYVLTDQLPTRFLIVNVFNDLIWIIPFFIIVWQGYRGKLNGNEQATKTSV